VPITGKGVSDPTYERREPGRLQPQFDYHDIDRYADLTNQNHFTQEHSSVNGDLPPLPSSFLANKKHNKNISAEVEATQEGDIVAGVRDAERAGDTQRTVPSRLWGGRQGNEKSRADTYVNRFGYILQLLRNPFIGVPVSDLQWFLAIVNVPGQ
jgi:hypothetical protein